MYAAQVQAWGEAPRYVEIPDRGHISPEGGFTRIKVYAVALHSLVRAIASGKRFNKTLPHIPGTDGVGIVESGPRKGQKVYFNAIASTGAFQEVVDVPEADVVELPDGVDPIQAARLMNPAFSSWMAIKCRAVNLGFGFNALILGATTTSGRIAVHILRSLGARKIIGLARTEANVKAMMLDGEIILKDPAKDTKFDGIEDIDVVLDYLGGDPATACLKALPTGRRVQYFQIGNMAGAEAHILLPNFRSRDIMFTGSGLGAWTAEELTRELPGLVAMLGQFSPIEVQSFPLQDVEKVWNEVDRPVFVTDVHFSKQ